MSQQNLLKFNFIVALVASLGSLYFSEIMLFPPCVLCWYQRICMYPLVALFIVAILKEDMDYSKYSFPLIAIGLAIAVYHNLLYYHIISDSITPCKQGISCTARQISWFGFVSIPLLSLSAFSLLFVSSIFNFSFKHKEISHEK